MSVLHLGEVGAGRVIPFEPSSDFSTVVLPEGSQGGNFSTVTVRGISLSDLGIVDGDKLVIRRKFSWREITEETICVVYMHSTGELVAKRIIRGANMLILRASGGGIPDREVSPDDIEIRGIAIDVQRPISEFIRLASA